MADTEYTGFMYAAHRDVLVVENLAKEIDPYTRGHRLPFAASSRKDGDERIHQNGIVP